MLNAAPSRSIDIARVIYHARVFNLWSENGMDTPPARAVNDLFDALDRGGVGYLLVGGIALLKYVDTRNTDDIDLILALPEARTIPGLIINEQDRDFARATFGELSVDLLLSSNPVFEHVLQAHATEALYEDRPIRLATALGLVLLKLYALPSLYRQASFDKVRLYETDISMLLQAQPMDTDAILGEIEPYVPAADLVELRGIVADLLQQIEKGGRFGTSHQ